MIPGAPELLENDLFNSPFLGKGRGLLGWKWEEGTGINVTSQCSEPSWASKGGGGSTPSRRGLCGKSVTSRCLLGMLASEY